MLAGMLVSQLLMFLVITSLPRVLSMGRGVIRYWGVVGCWGVLVCWGVIILMRWLSRRCPNQLCSFPVQPNT